MVTKSICRHVPASATETSAQQRHDVLMASFHNTIAFNAARRLKKTMPVVSRFLLFGEHCDSWGFLICHGGRIPDLSSIRSAIWTCCLWSSVYISTAAARLVQVQQCFIWQHCGRLATKNFPVNVVVELLCVSSRRHHWDLHRSRAE